MILRGIFLEVYDHLHIFSLNSTRKK